MKKILSLAIVLFLGAKVNAQSIVAKPGDTRVITTGTAFLLIASDARAAALGDQGVATSPDAYSQQWNASKYAFAKSDRGIAISYTPYLSELVNDIFLGNFTYYNKLDERSALSASFRYFSLGEIEFRDDANSPGIKEKPNELTIDVAYSLKLSDQFSMGVGLRYLRSDLKFQNTLQGVDAKAASSFAVDIGGYYQSEEKAYGSFNGRWRGGFGIQNIGPKIKYDEGGKENFLPTTLRLGGGFDFILDEANRIAVNLETTKLMVPTPPVRGFVDTNNNGVQDSGEPDAIAEGQEDNVGFFSGMFQSFGDAPGGFSEELREFTYSIGGEYTYLDSFAFRGGYFNEHKTKGARKFFAIGAGFKYTIINIDVSYLFSTSQVKSPLENTLRFSLAFHF